MPRAVCKLCLQVRDLQRSHLFPAAFYRMTRRDERGAPPLLTTEHIAVPTTKQIADYVLCRGCEQRFNDYGERWTVTHVHDGTRFPLLEALQSAEPLSSGPAGSRLFDGRRAGVRVDQLAYFALSVFWRASVHAWPGPHGGQISTSIGTWETAARRYLAGEADFPPDAALVVTVGTDEFCQRQVMTPFEFEHNGRISYVFLARGIQFKLFCGENVRPATRRLCCFRSGVILTGPCVAVRHAAADLYANTRVSSKLTRP